MSEIYTCPVCQKGKMIEHNFKFQCDFVQNDNLCNFTIWKIIFKKNIDNKILSDLIKHKKTDIYTDWINKEDKNFSARLIIKDGFVTPFFENPIIDDVKCVACEGAIFKTSKGYVCENFYKNECFMFIYDTYSNHKLKIDEVKILVEGGRTELINDFVSQNGKKFSAFLFVNDDNFKVEFEYLNSSDNIKIADCPKCKSGDIVKRSKFFACSNYFDENIKCDFSVWTSILGYELTDNDVKELIAKKSTDEKTFSWKNKESKGKLILNDNFKVVKE